MGERGERGERWERGERDGRDGREGRKGREREGWQTDRQTDRQTPSATSHLKRLRTQDIDRLIYGNRSTPDTEATLL